MTRGYVVPDFGRPPTKKGPSSKNAPVRNASPGSRRPDLRIRFGQAWPCTC